VVDLRELRGHVNLRAAAIIRPSGAFADPLKMSVQLGGCIVYVLPGDAIPGSPKILVLAPEKCCNQVVFRSEVPVEARLRHPGLLNDEVNPHRTHAALIKKHARSFENSGPHLSIILGVRCRHGLRHDRSNSRSAHPFLTCYRPVRIVQKQTGL